MDQDTRNRFEQLCALAEIEENPNKFAEISDDIVRILDEKETRLSGKRLSGRARRAAAAPSVA
jgi:hypothetical protein